MNFCPFRLDATTFCTFLKARKYNDLYFISFIRLKNYFFIMRLNRLYARNTSALVSECFYKSGSGVTPISATHRKV